MFNDEQARDDPAAADDALFRIAHAKRGHSGFFDAVGAVTATSPDDDAALLATFGIVAGGIGFEAAVGMSGYGSLVNACKGAALNEGNRLRTRTGVAEYLVEPSDTLLERGIGASIVENVGRPADRIDRLRDERCLPEFALESWPRGANDRLRRPAAA